VQEGRKVFKEVCPAVAEQISAQLADIAMPPEALKRLWLHQANLNMNQLIARRVLGRDPSVDEAPVILDRYANTSSAGSVIAFHLTTQTLNPVSAACCAPSAPATVSAASSSNAADRVPRGAAHARLSSAASSAASSCSACVSVPMLMRR
jgi:hypothetical protein